MSKSITIFECSKCGAQFPAWEGRCRECGAWGTLQQSQIVKSSIDKSSNILADDNDLIDLNSLNNKSLVRTALQNSELNRVLGGGLVSGSLVLLSGDAGVGKSTLVFKIAELLSMQNKSVFYVSGEESPEQIKTRIDKMNLKLNNVKLINKTNVDNICAILTKYKPKLAIIDSIQTIYTNEIDSEAGSQTQIKAGVSKLLGVAKKDKITLLIIGHVTKDGNMAGPKTMEHLVDVVLYLQGDKNNNFRILRAHKNRFGTTNEIGIFKMTNKGLFTVNNPAEIFISKNKTSTPGTVTSVIWEGSRAFLVEIQALVNKTNFKYPKRTAHGIENNRLQLLLAVLEKQSKISLKYDDVYLNLAGGLKTKDRGLDLAICLSIVSAKKNKNFSNNNIAIGEISLNGEIKPVINLETKIREAIRLGYKNIIIPKTNLKYKSSQANITMLDSLMQAVKLI